MERFPIGRATRDAYGEVLAALGADHPEIVVLDGDLAKSTKSAVFAERFPDRFFNAGIAEANMAGIASGLAACGKIPFISSFASFLICKTFDQLRLGVSYSKLPVKLVGSHGGITLGPDGVSQMSIEDIALAASLPGMTVVVPADEVSTGALVPQVYAHPGAVFLRTGRNKVPRIYDPGDTDFQLGKGRVLRKGGDVALVACGIMVAEAIYAAQVLEAEGVSCTVVDMHTVKPIDEELLVLVARECGAVVTAEEHQIYGGLGAIVSSVLGRNHPVPLEHVALRDTFAKSGEPEELKKLYGLTWREIVIAVERVLGRKRRELSEE
ncbi:MAG: transketolase family protein [Candidatus Hydrogenedentota bacterium]|nr:MAG: transketolase family protein [Candidatus Hydrogenedentota bacterium]